MRRRQGSSRAFGSRPNKTARRGRGSAAGGSDAATDADVEYESDDESSEASDSDDDYEDSNAKHFFKKQYDQACHSALRCGDTPLPEIRTRPRRTAQVVDYRERSIRDIPFRTAASPPKVSRIASVSWGML